LFGNLALAGDMQVEELAPRMRGTADLGDALLESGFKRWLRKFGQ
jgi:hypothetical protein